MVGGRPLARTCALTAFALVVALLALLPDRAAAASGWQVVLDRPTPNFGAVDFVSDTEGWMPAGAGLLHTTDGGATWTENAKLTVNDVDFFDQQHGWAVGPDAAIFHTADGGETWSQQESGLYGAMYFTDVEAISSSEAWAVALQDQSDTPHFPIGSALLHIADSGATWLPVELPAYAWFSEIEFVGRSGWLLGSICEPDCSGPGNIHTALLRTTDSGAAWEPSAIAPPPTARDLTFATASDGWVLSESCPINACTRSVYHTADGGVTWAQTQITTLGFNAQLEFQDEITGWLVGDTCIERDCTFHVLSSTDGGVTWNETSSFAQEEGTYLGQFRAFRNRFYLLGVRLALRSSDGGLTWQEMQTPAMYLGPPDFVDRRMGFTNAVGNLLRTEDAGATWRLVAPLPDGVEHVDFIDADLGYALGVSCCPPDRSGVHIYKTEDGGQHWKQVDETSSFGQMFVYDFEFADALHGLVALEGGFLMTDDGGETWRERTLEGLGSYVQGADLAEGGHAWAIVSGQDATSTLVRTQDGGRTWEPAPPLPSGSARKIQFVDADHGFYLGGTCNETCQDTIYTTNDAGETWEARTNKLQPAYPPELLFVDRVNGWLNESSCDANGCAYQISHTADGGKTWRSQLEGTLISGTFEFIDAENGWLLLDPSRAYGNGGAPPQRTTLYHTTDGGGGPIGEAPPVFPDVGAGPGRSADSPVLPLFLLGTAGLLSLAASFALRRRSIM